MTMLRAHNLVAVGISRQAPFLRHLTSAFSPSPSPLPPLPSSSSSSPSSSSLPVFPPLPNHAHLLLARVHSASPSSSSSLHKDEPSYNSPPLGGEAEAEDGAFLAQADDEDWYRAQAEDEEWFRREESFYNSRMSDAANGVAREGEAEDYLGLSDSALFAQCRMDTFRASGPGGQHRNKTDSGVRLTHLPTSLVSQAVEDRSQHKNRAIAMNRLRFLIAAKVRRPLKLHGYRPPAELVRLLPAETGKKNIGEKIGVNHPDYPKGVQALLDLLAASQGYVLYAATVLKVSPAAISKILTSDKTIHQATNELLISKGQKPFK